jgi:molybdate/tungstate transport system substrate-binding protein
MRAPRALALGSALALVAAGGFEAVALASGHPAHTTAHARAADKGTVGVLYAGSLVDYMENDLGPAFHTASGYGYEGFGGGSTEVANQIRGGVREGDVFVSASAKADHSLEGAAGGNWVSWYSTFAATPLMLGYDPHSSFGKQLAHGKPWYKVITEPGILVGRTDPKLDPKGVLTVESVANAASKLHSPKLAAALDTFPVYPETALVGRLQSGQLDAGFFYAVEASSSHFPTVKLTPAYKYALYTVTILSHAANPAGAAALVRYLLNSARKSTLKRNGLAPQKPSFSGNAAAVPAGLRGVVGAG